MKRKLLVMSLMLIMLIMTSTTVFAAGTLNTNNSTAEVVSADYSGDLADNQFKYTYVDTKETVITSYYAMGAKSSGKTEYTSDKIIRIIFQDTLTAPKNSVDSWDASSARDESVMAWVVPNAVSGEYYDLYLGSDGKIIAPYASHNLFAGYRYLTEIVNLSLLDTSNVHSMQGMFRENSNLVSLDVSNFDTTNVTDMRWMFSAGGSIQHLDVSSWNTSNVTTMNCMFASCTSLKSIDVSKFDTSSVQDFSGMFYFCTSLKTIDVKNFDTSSAKSMVAMFAGCSGLTYLNLRNFDTSALDGTDSGISWIDDTEINKNVDRMFYFCTSLKSVVLGKNFTRLDGNKMFAYASRLSSLIVENPNIIPLATETNIAKAMNIYLSNPTIEALYEKDETYLSVFGVDRIKSILGVSGNNPTSTYYNKTYVDAGPLVAGFDNNQKSLYEPYGYTVITSGMPVDTTTKTDKKVTYTIFDSDGNELMSVSRTVIIKDTTTLMSREDTSYALGAYNAGKTTYTSESIKEIHFVDTTITGAPTSGTWDVSHLEDGSIIAWVEQNASDTSKYNLYIGSDYTICLPADSSYLFSYYSNCSVISGLENIDTQNVTDFTSAFRECNVLETVDVGNWNTENVTSMRSTFYNCYKVNELDVSKWVTTKVTDMGWMFYYCESLESIDVSGFDTTYVTNMKSMFNTCELLKEIDVSSWNTGKVLDMSYLFGGCIALESINVSEWNLISLENAINLFDGCSLLERIDVSNWNVSNISDMQGMFQNCIALKELDVSKWVTTNVTDMGWLFYHCESLESIDVSDFDTTNVTNMRSMFNGCKLLKEIDVSSWNVSKVENTTYMFADCYTLETLNVSSWNTSKILDMGYMFSQCYKLKELDVSKWVTTNVTNMGWLFYYCESLESLNLLNFDTSSVTNMRSMFSGCKNIKTLNLRNFNTSSAIEMHYMFNNAQKLQSVLLGENFDRLHGQYIFSNTLGLKAIIAERETPMDISGDNMSLRSSTNLYVANTEIEEVYEDNEELLALFGVERIKPLLDINGSNPATIALGKTYVDAGPLVAGFNNLNSTYYTEYGYYVVSNGDTIDTTTTTPKYITYTLYDSNNVELMSLTRTVNIMDTGNLIARDFTSRTYSSTEVIEEWERQVTYTSGNKAIYTYYALGAAKANQTKYTANLIKEIHFIDTSVTEAPTTFEKSWDVSENQDGSMTAWIVVNSEDSTMYDLYIGSMLKMSMPAGSAYFFAYYINCTEITGLENLDTSNVTAMNQLFYKDRTVEELNIGSWDVSNVTSLYSTFCYCESLTDLDISSWDVGNVTTMRYIFAYCYDLQMLDLNEWNTEKVTLLNSAFNGNSSLTAVYVSNWNTARVTDMSYMFNGCTSLVTADVSNWNTDEVTNLNSMFYNCNNLEVIDVSNWNTAKVTSMRFLFNGCKAVTTLDLRNWNTAKVTDFSAMFYNCTKVTDLDVSNFNTSSAKVMALMFNNCDALTKLDLRSFDTSALDGTESGYSWSSDQTNCVNVDGLLNGCENIQSIVIGDKLSRLDGKHMFSATNSLSAIIVTKNISSSSEAMTLGLTTSLNTNAILYVPSEEAENAYENATNYSEVFGADRIKPILEVKGLNPMTVLIGETYDDKKDQGALVAGFSNLNQTNMYSSYGYSVITSGLPISTSTESSGKIVTYVLMYKDADSGDSEAVEIMRTTRNVNVVEIPLLMEREYPMYAIGAYREYINTSDETYLNYKAELISKIVLTDSNIVPTDGSVVSSWDVSYAYGNGLIMAWITESTESSGYYDLYIGGFKGMLAPADSYGLFRGYTNCSKIESLEHMDTSQVTDMGYMFYDCMKLKTLDLTSFNTGNVTNMCSMFYKCWELENLKISNLNTSNVEDMSWIFMQCYLLKEIDLTGIDTSNVKDMSCMFDYCTSLTGVDVSGFNTSNVINMAGMFYKCTSLLSVDVSNFDTSKVESMGGMFFRCNKLTALDLGNFDLSSINNTTGNNILLEDGSYGVNLNEMFYDCTKLELLILGSKFDKINGSKMFYNTTALKKIITERNISSSNDAMTLSTDTELSDVTTLYVLSLTAEEAYENATNYNDVFGTERIKPILELNGINPVIVAEGVIYSVAKDAGVLVAGYSNILESNKYDSYGYSVRTTGLPITTTASSSNVVTYTLTYKAEESGDDEAVEVMSVTRTVNGRDKVATLTETKNGTTTTKNYLSLLEAINASSNMSELDEGTYSEITMMQDEELTETLTLNNKKIRLNTNGNDIFTDNSDNSITSTIIMFKPVSSIFAIKDDASEKGKISIQGGNVSSQIIESTYSDIIIEGGSLEVSCDNWSIAIKASSGTVNVKDGDIVAQVPSSGTAYALEIGTQAVVNVSGGDISAIHNGSGTARAIQNWNSSADSTLVVSGGMLSATSASGTPTAIYSTGATVLINGGTLKANSTSNTATALDNTNGVVTVSAGKLYAESNNSAIGIMDYNNEVIIDGTAVIETNAQSWSIPIKINAGKLNLKNGDLLATTTNGSAYGVELSTSSEMQMTGGTINVTATGTGIARGIQNWNNISGKVLEISGGIIEAKAESGMAIGIYSPTDVGTTNIIAGKITADSTTGYAHGVYVTTSGEILTIGSDLDKSTKETPIIMGKTYGVYSGGKFAFYDGTLKGQTKAYYGEISTIDSYPVIENQEVIEEVTYNIAYVGSILMEREETLWDSEIGWQYHAIGARRANQKTGNAKYLEYKAELIKTITILDTNVVPDDVSADAYWDVSYKYGDNNVMAWVYPSGEYYELYIGGNGKIVAPEDSSNLFESYEICTEIKGLELLDTSKATTMEQMFYNCEVITKLNVSNFKMGNVTNTKNMFYACRKVTELDVSNWDTSKIESMNWMFWNCNSLKTLDVSKWDTSSLTDMTYLFVGCSKLEEVDVSKWDTSDVMKMSAVFSGCYSLKSVDVSKWDTKNVTNMRSLFERCSALTEIDLSNFDTSKVTDMSGMFSDCTGITTLNITNFDTSKVTDMSEMFKNCKKLKTIDLTNFNSESLGTIYDMFYGCTSLNLLIFGEEFTNLNSCHNFFPDTEGLFAGSTSPMAFITQKAITSSGDVMLMSGDTNLDELENIILYVPDEASEKAYEASEAYINAFSGDNDVDGDIYRIKPILEVSGENPVEVFINSTYDATIDEGAIVAGMDIAELNECYEGYAVTEDFSSVSTTTPGTDSKVVYTLTYTDPDNENATAQTIMTAERTVKTVVGYSDGTNIYKTLSDAFENAPYGATIKPIADITDSVAAIVPEGQSVTLDLDGKTISSGLEDGALVTNYGTLNLIDSVGGGSFEVVLTDDATLGKYPSLIRNVGGTVNVNSGEYKVEGGHTTIDHTMYNDSGTLNINGGKISLIEHKKDENAGHHEIQNIYAAGGTINVNSGEIYTYSDVDYKYANGIINNGEADAQINVFGGKITTITAGTEGAAYAVSAVNYSDNGAVTSIHIKGSAVLEAQGYYVRTICNVGSKADVVIEGGTISASNGTDLAAVWNDTSDTILGSDDGTVNFVSPIIRSDHYAFKCTEGMSTDIKFYDGEIQGKEGILSGATEITDLADDYGLYYGTRVIDGTTYNTATLATLDYYKVEDSYYSTLAEAYAAIDTVGEIIVNKDCEDSSDVVMDKDITLNLNGKTITRSGTITNYGTFKVKGEGTITGTNLSFLINEGTYIHEDATLYVNAENWGETIEPIKNYGTIVMNSGLLKIVATATGGNEYVITDFGGNITMNGGSIELERNVETEWADVSYAIYLYSNNGTLTVNDGSISAIDNGDGSETAAIGTNTESTITIGTSDETVSTETPVIYGEDYAIASWTIVDVGSLNFYDGVMKSKGVVIDENLSKVSTQNGTAMVISNETVDEAVYEIATLREAYYIVGDTNYVTLIEAFNAAESGDTITVIKDVEENTTGLVAEGKSLVFDLNGHEVSFEGNAKLEVEGNLNIAGEGSIVKINNTSEAIHITYTGTLTLGENEGTVSADEPLIKSDTVAIVNEGTLNFYDGRVSAIEDPLDGKVTVYVSGYHLVEKVNGDYTEIYLTSNDVFIERWDISLEAGVDNVYAGIKVLSGDGISEDTTYVLEVGGTGRTKDYTFEYTNDVTYPYKVTTPWHEKYWQSIVELELEEGVTEYNALLFAGLASINSIELPNSLTAIGKQAFRDMEALNCSVMIPSNVTTIDENPFIKTPITEFKVESDNTTFVVDNGVLYDNVAKRLVAYPSGKEEITYTIKTDTKVIGVYAFLNENEIKEVILPEGLETIDGGAFQTTGLEKITIPNSVNEVSWFAFASSSNLKYVYFKPTSSITISSDNSFSGLAQDSIIYTESKAIAEMFEPDSTYTSSTTQVYYPFTLTSELPNQELERGDTLTFAPTIEEGFTSDDVIYQWYLNDVAIDDATSAIYTKTGFDETDAGEYKLVIKSVIQENGEYYYTVTSNVATVKKVDLTGPSSINTSVEYKEDGTATITVTTADTDSGISSIRINDERIEITKNEATSSATGKFTVSTKGEYEIRATDGLNNSTSIILNAYEVTYNSNAAVYTGTTAMQIKIEDAPITLHENGFKRVGYTFQNWNTASDATGLTYTEGATYSENANVTLYAVWQARKYTVRFYNDNGIDGEHLISEKEYNYGDLITVPGVQERIGELVDDNTYRIFYHNNTWRAEKEDQESIDSVVNITDSNKDSITMIDSNVNYYATYATKDFSNTSGTTIINGKSEVSGTTYGILNELGLVIIGNNSVANSVPTISGDTTMAAIVNNGGLLLWYMGELHGPVQGLVVQK